MTTSQQTDSLDFPTLRALVDTASGLPLADRVTLLKGLVPGIVRDLDPASFDALVVELGLKGERMLEAMAHPGEGRATRRIPGERDLEGR